MMFMNLKHVRDFKKYSWIWILMNIFRQMNKILISWTFFWIWWTNSQFTSIFRNWMNFLKSEWTFFCIWWTFLKIMVNKIWIRSICFWVRWIFFWKIDEQILNSMIKIWILWTIIEIYEYIFENDEQIVNTMDISWILIKVF